jgi:signal transduction histidine kinase/streptogramin lyase
MSKVSLSLSLQHSYQGEPYFETVTENIITNGIITALASDQQGFLWIGSQEGLFRYDGNEFKVWRFNAEPGYSIPANYIRSIYPANNGEIWVAIQGLGISIINPKKQTVRIIRQLANGDGLSNDVVLDIKGGINNDVWVGTIDALDHFTQDGLHLKSYPLNIKEGIANVRTVLPEKNGNVLLGTTQGLGLYSVKEDRVIPYLSVKGDPNGLYGTYVYSLYRDSYQRLWIGTTNKGAAWLDETSNTLKWLPIGDNGLQHRWLGSMVQSSEERIWFSTFGAGIAEVDIRTGQVIRHIQRDLALPGSVGSDQISPLIKDPSGQIWVGTWGGGLQRYLSGNNTFHMLRHRTGSSYSLSKPDVRSLIEAEENTIWVGTAGKGINAVRINDNQTLEFMPSPDTRLQLQNEFISAMAKTVDQSIWVATQSNGLYRYISTDAGFRAITTEQGLSTNQIKALEASQNGNLWIGSNRGLDFLDIDTESVKNINIPTSGFIMRDIMEDQAGNLWIGTANGLFLLPENSSQVLQIKSFDSNGKEITFGVFTIVQDPNATVLLDTSLGLLKISKWLEDRIVLEKVHKSLPNQSIGKNIVWDQNARLWTPQFTLDKSTNASPYKLLRADGVDVGTTFPGANIMSDSGWIFFGGTKGLLAINPVKFSPWEYQPLIAVTSLKVDRQSLPLSSIKNGLKLSSAYQSFEFEFVSLDLSAPNEIQYRFRLSPGDENWNYTDANRRVANYGKLAPGQYEMQVQGTNRRGQWSDKTKLIKISVEPAIWQTPAFVIIAFLAIITMVVGLIKWRTQYLKRQASYLKFQVETKTSQLAEVIHNLEKSNKKILATQKQLIQSSKMASIGTMTAGVAHEINNPTNFAHAAVYMMKTEINEIKAFLKQLAGGDNAEPEVLQSFDDKFTKLVELTKTATEGTTRIKTIVEDLRTFARLDDAKQAQIQVSDLINSTVHLVRTQYDSIIIETQLDYEPLFKCFPSKLNQVFMNIIVNACQAIESKKTFSENFEGKVLIKTKQSKTDQHGDRLIITFEDNGCGMTEETLQRIFEPFFTTKDVGSGTGLGMAISFGIIEEHAGSIKVESTVKDGTKIIISFTF